MGALEYERDAQGLFTGFAAAFLADTVTVRHPTQVPEPATSMLLLAGLTALGLARRKTNNR